MKSRAATLKNPGIMYSVVACAVGMGCFVGFYNFLSGIPASRALAGAIFLTMGALVAWFVYRFISGNNNGLCTMIIVVTPYLNNIRSCRRLTFIYVIWNSLIIGLSAGVMIRVTEMLIKRKPNAGIVDHPLSDIDVDAPLSS